MFYPRQRHQSHVQSWPPVFGQRCVRTGASVWGKGNGIDLMHFRHQGCCSMPSVQGYLTPPCKGTASMANRQAAVFSTGTGPALTPSFKQSPAPIPAVQPLFPLLSRRSALINYHLEADSVTSQGRTLCWCHLWSWRCRTLFCFIRWV